MKKLFLKITLCIFITSINLLIELYPTGKIYLKYHICNMNLNDYISKIKSSDYLSFFDETEKENLNTLSEIQNMMCNKNNIQTNKMSVNNSRLSK